MKERPIIVGGGSHARSLVAMAPASLRPEAYVDTQPNMPLQWLGNDDEFIANPLYADYPLILGYVAPADYTMGTRRRIIEKYGGRRFTTIVSEKAVICPDTVLGEGSMVFPTAVVNTGSFLGNHVVINTGAIVEHDVVIGQNTFVGPGAVICGGVTIGRDVYIGAGACIRNGVTIADGVTIGIGSVVMRDITVPGKYFGNPVRRLI